jgi:hypothetical protein
MGEMPWAAKPWHAANFMHKAIFKHSHSFMLVYPEAAGSPDRARKPASLHKIPA